MNAILADIARMDPRTRFVVISGDLTNHGDLPAYKALWEHSQTSARKTGLSIGFAPQPSMREVLRAQDRAAMNAHIAAYEAELVQKRAAGSRQVLKLAE